MKKQKNKSHASVSEMLRDMGPELEAIASDVELQVKQRRLVRQLANFRHAKRVTQEQVAEHLGAKQSRVSKIENGLDDDLSLAELKAYAKALDCDVELVLKSREFSIVDEVKFHACAIKHCLDKLNSLVKHDSSIANGVAKFHIEALFNLLGMVDQSAKDFVAIRRLSAPPEVILEVREPEMAKRDDLAKCEDSEVVHEPLSA